MVREGKKRKENKRKGKINNEVPIMIPIAIGRNYALVITQ
jgi:hypothetical protein